MTERKCPKCGSKNIANIVYGLPSLTDIIETGTEKYYAGCCIPEPFPKKHCNDCEYDFSYESIFGNDLSKERA